MEEIWARTDRMLIGWDVPIEMDDNLVLRADVFRPADNDACPVILAYGPNANLAFWGNTAYQGTYNGFRIIDITDPDDPQEHITYEGCEGNQGDVMIWDTLLIRSWNSPAPADNPETPEDESVDCGGEDVPAGFEGLHLFNVSDPANPELMDRLSSSRFP